MSLMAACWRAAVGQSFPLMVLLLLSGLWDDGFSWRGLGGQAAGTLLTWAILSGCWAASARLSLRRRARAVGIVLPAGALEEQQTQLLWAADRADDGWQDRVRERLTACERAFLVLEPARDEVTFRWRTGRREGQSVRGSLTFDALSGTVLLDVRGGEDHLGVAGLLKGAAFAAMCRIAGELGLTGSKGGRPSASCGRD